MRTFSPPPATPPQTGFAFVWDNRTGLFSFALQATGWSASNKLMPALLASFNWSASYLDADLAARHVAGIPGFAYAEDAAALYAALLRYATTRLQASYGQGAALVGDAQLAAFLVDLHEGGPAALRGFPGPGEVTSVDDLARIAAQVRHRNAVLVCRGDLGRR